MRRNDRAVTDPSAIRTILDRSDVCRLAFAAGDEPYLVTLNFGYVWDERLTLYFHCALEGKKLELMKRNSRVCFEMDTDHELVPGETVSCGWTMRYASVVGWGVLLEITDAVERAAGLDAIMRHYGAVEKGNYDPRVLAKTVVLKLIADTFTSKRRA